MGSSQKILGALVALSLCFSVSLARVWESNFGVTKRGGLRSGGLFFKKSEELPGFTVASRHESVVLECQAGGRTPTIHWLHRGARIQQGFTRDYLDDEAAYEEPLNSGDDSVIGLSFTKSKLFLDCITPAQAGEYSCVAETATERISQNTEVIVDDAYNGHENCLAKRSVQVRREPARIYLWTSNRLEQQGRAVQLFCRVEGYPTPTLTWYDNRGREISPDNDSYQLLDNGDLLIKHISWANMGRFRCEASNELGTDTVATFLYPTRSSNRSS